MDRSVLLLTGLSCFLVLVPLTWAPVDAVEGPWPGNTVQAAFWSMVGEWGTSPDDDPWEDLAALIVFGVVILSAPVAGFLALIAAASGHRFRSRPWLSGAAWTSLLLPLLFTVALVGDGLFGDGDGRDRIAVTLAGVILPLPVTVGMFLCRSCLGRVFLAVTASGALHATIGMLFLLLEDPTMALLWAWALGGSAVTILALAGWIRDHRDMASWASTAS